MSSSFEPARRGERGAVTWVTLLLLALLVAAGYLLRVWGPIYVVHYEVKQVVRDFGNQAVKNPNDAELVERMCQRLQALDRAPVRAPDGTLEVVPVVEVHPQEVAWARDGSSVPPRLRVTFAYRRQVHYPIFDAWRETEMQVDVEMDLGRADCGGGR